MTTNPPPLWWSPTQGLLYQSGNDIVGMGRPDWWSGPFVEMPADAARLEQARPNKPGPIARYDSERLALDEYSMACQRTGGIPETKADHIRALRHVVGVLLYGEPIATEQGAVGPAATKPAPKNGMSWSDAYSQRTYWVRGSGEPIPIAQMSTPHIRNVVNYMRTNVRDIRLAVEMSELGYIGADAPYEVASRVGEREGSDLEWLEATPLYQAMVAWMTSS